VVVKLIDGRLLRRLGELTRCRFREMTTSEARWLPAWEGLVFRRSFRVIDDDEIAGPVR
jgi:hypothetical protein